MKKFLGWIFLFIFVIGAAGCGTRQNSESEKAGSKQTIPTGTYYGQNNSECFVEIKKDSVVLCKPDWEVTARMYAFPRCLDEVTGKRAEGYVVDEEMENNIRDRLMKEFTSAPYEGKEYSFRTEFTEEYPQKDWIYTIDSDGSELDFLSGSYERDSHILWIAGAPYKLNE